MIRNILMVSIAANILSGCLSIPSKAYFNSTVNKPPLDESRNFVTLELTSTILGSYLVYENSELIGLFGSNDKYFPKNKIMRWNVIPGTHKITVKNAKYLYCENPFWSCVREAIHATPETGDRARSDSIVIEVNESIEPTEVKIALTRDDWSIKTHPKFKLEKL